MIKAEAVKKYLNKTITTILNTNGSTFNWQPANHIVGWESLSTWLSPSVWNTNMIVGVLSVVDETTNTLTIINDTTEYIVSCDDIVYCMVARQ